MYDNTLLAPLLLKIPYPDPSCKACDDQPRSTLAYSLISLISLEASTKHIAQNSRLVLCSRGQFKVLALELGSFPTTEHCTLVRADRRIDACKFITGVIVIERTVEASSKDSLCK